MSDRPVVFMLHALGGSARAWEAVSASLGTEFDVVAIDLPGFGQAQDASDLTVAGMVRHVADIVRSTEAARWLLVGHSMGGKVASIIAARALAGEAGLFGLAGVVLLAGSPPSPEPMDEHRRQRMIALAAHGSLNAAAARSFVDDNVGSALPPPADRVALEDLQRTSSHAWRAWFERGSREDWSQEVGTLDVPALIIVGGADGDLGEAGQRATNAIVYPRASLAVEPGAGHLLPLERPKEVAEAIARFWNEAASKGPAVPESFVQLIASPRVSHRARAALANRSLPDHYDYSPVALSAMQLKTLRSLAGCVIPQRGASIDLAARIDAGLAAGAGDGWRFSDLPPDREAYAAALDGLVGFDTLADGEQQDRLKCLALGELAVPTMSGRQMMRWFEDLRADLVRAWVSHPATMARIGFDGFANGGDDVRKQGFERLAADEREAWEPTMEVQQ
jgi:pimeloyl-ACP methyl ester carboxylesterase